MIIFHIYIYECSGDNLGHHFSQGEQTQRGETIWREVYQWNL
jgi:hypothetical protein